MNFLQHLLEGALGVGQAHPKPLGNNTPAAKQYAQNPQASHEDPAQFGYPADASLANNAGVPHGLLVGSSNMQGLPQGGQFNPGYVPLQSPRGYSAHPQIQAYGGVQRPGDQVNPQSTGFSWNNY